MESRDSVRSPRPTYSRPYSTSSQGGSTATNRDGQTIPSAWEHPCQSLADIIAETEERAKTCRAHKIHFQTKFNAMAREASPGVVDAMMKSDIGRNPCEEHPELWECFETWQKWAIEELEEQLSLAKHRSRLGELDGRFGGPTGSSLIGTVGGALSTATQAVMSNGPEMAGSAARWVSGWLRRTREPDEEAGRSQGCTGREDREDRLF
ncbi:hypothetical protein L204_100979 [Cryptococcus depauperatus]|nr:hypothetical protein L204_01090 [Cryptococcus depauperatus CBS 7855]